MPSAGDRFRLSLFIKRLSVYYLFKRIMDQEKSANNMMLNHDCTASRTHRSLSPHLMYKLVAKQFGSYSKSFKLWRSFLGSRRNLCM